MSIPRPTPRPIRLPINDFPEVNTLLNDPALSGLYLFEPDLKLIDSSNNELHGSITGAVYKGNSLLFSNDNVDLNNNHDLTNIATKMSVFVLAKTDDTGSEISIVDKLTGSGWILRKSGTDKFRFRIIGNTINNSVDSVDSIQQNVWFTGCGTYSGSGNKTGIKAYLNKVSATGTGAVMQDPTSNIGDCRFGSDATGAGSYWSGNEALVVIWIGKELNQSEVDSMHDFAMSLI